MSTQYIKPSFFFKTARKILFSKICSLWMFHVWRWWCGMRVLRLQYCPKTTILTPPTRSKWSTSWWKSMGWPLKAQEKATSKAGSAVTWQGSTMLSPTVISVLLGPWLILVGSVSYSANTVCQFSSGTQTKARKFLLWPRQLLFSKNPVCCLWKQYFKLLQKDRLHNYSAL